MIKSKNESMQGLETKPYKDKWITLYRYPHEKSKAGHGHFFGLHFLIAVVIGKKFRDHS